MGSSALILSLLGLLLVGGAFASRPKNAIFDKTYEITWGKNHVQSLDQGREIQLTMDKSSGSGFGSKLNYGSGFFSLTIKLPGGDSAGVVTAFYMRSQSNIDHDELDFEFLGNKEEKPYTLQTNVFTHGKGNREQRIRLWFDPSADFHTYKILWNHHQIVFYVDTVPIRVFKNKESTGVGYPTQAMTIEGSIWDGDSWATDGGQTKTDWSTAPFKTYFQGFNIDGCPSNHQVTTTDQPNPCFSSKYWWNSKKYWELDSEQERAYQGVKRNYMTYDYCTDSSRYPTPPPECPQ